MIVSCTTSAYLCADGVLPTCNAVSLMNDHEKAIKECAEAEAVLNKEITKAKTFIQEFQRGQRRRLWILLITYTAISMCIGAVCYFAVKAILNAIK